MRSYIPYAAINTAMGGGDNSKTESYCYCLSYVGCALGSATVMFVRERIIGNDQIIWGMILFYTALAGVFLWIATDDSGLWQWEGANEFLVVIVFVMRYIDGFVCPVLWINIDTRYKSTSLKMNQWLTVVALIVQFCCVWIAYFLIDDYDL